MNMEKKGFICLLYVFLFFSICIEGYSAPPNQKQWKLVWSDEFDSGSERVYPDANYWSYEMGYKRNREDQYYTDDIRNAYCKDGFLHLEAHKHPVGTFPKGEQEKQDGSISSASAVSIK